jgi:endonuclease/exonuclease/phosphatase (EEP) superfamily protein YafD
MLIVFIWITEKWKWYDTLFASMIAASMLFQSSYLINYTPLVSKAVPDALTNNEGLKLLVYNLYLENENYNEVLNMLNKANADVLVILETTTVWEQKLASLKKKYPFTTGTANKVGYGMTIYSNIPMENLEKHYLNNKNVPSYSFEIQPDNMPQIQIYSVHPPPPKHFENMPDNEGKKEVALSFIGNRIKNDNKPVIVMGDLNDVAWGDTERLMQAGNKLHDVRVGRGFYNTFSAHNYLLRWPLDHVFVTEHFTLKNIQLFNNAGSDHYPVFVELIYKN